MANALYDKGRQAFLEGGIAWLTDTIKLLLATSGYTPNLATHQYVSDVGGGNEVVRSGAFAGKSSTAGVADANDVTLSAVTGSTATYIIIYKDSGVDASSPLIACIDTATNLPVTPNGGDITVQWDSGANKIFKL